MPPVRGEINGLPHMQGIAVATNGILVLIEHSNGDHSIGHLEWFVKHEEETNGVAAKPSRNVSLKGMEEFFV